MIYSQWILAQRDELHQNKQFICLLHVIFRLYRCYFHKPDLLTGASIYGTGRVFIYKGNINTSAQQSVCYCHINITVDDMFRLSRSHHQVHTRIHKTIQIYAYEWDPITFTNGSYTTHLFCRLQPAKRTPPNTSRSKNSNTQRTENKTTDVVIHQHSRRLLKMDILISETCWAHNKWNKITKDIKLVFHSTY